MEGEEDDYQSGEDNILSSSDSDMENVENETGETEENQAEQTSEGGSEGSDSESEGEQSEGEPAETAEPTATPDSYVSLIQETNEHLANIELMGGALFGVLGLFLGVYLIHDFFDSVKKI